MFTAKYFALGDFEILSNQRTVKIMWTGYIGDGLNTFCIVRGHEPSGDLRVECYSLRRRVWVSH